MTVQDMVYEYLKYHGFEGLVAEGGECGCTLDGLAPCDEMKDDCKAGYKVPCGGPDKCVAAGDCYWHISTIKPETPFDKLKPQTKPVEGETE